MPKLKFFCELFFSNEQKSGETSSFANLKLGSRERWKQRTFMSSYSMKRTMSLSSTDQMKWQEWQKRQDWLVIAAEMAWNVMIRNDIDLAMTLSLSGPLALWPSLCRSRSLAVSLSCACSFALTISLLLSCSCACAFALALALSLCHTSLEIVFATKEQRLFHGTVEKKSIDTSGRNDIFHNTDLVAFLTLKELLCLRRTEI